MEFGILAKSAREMANKVQADRREHEMTALHDAILKAASKGEYATEVNYLSDYAYHLLASCGYNIKEEKDCGFGYELYYIISWEES